MVDVLVHLVLEEVLRHGADRVDGLLQVVPDAVVLAVLLLLVVLPQLPQKLEYLVLPLVLLLLVQVRLLLN